jgi:hypothetical protein
MAHGSGQAIRQAMMYTKPWQRYVIAAALIAGGVGLVAVGRLTGVVFVAVGALLLWRMVRDRVRSRHEAQRFVDR